MAIFIIDIYRQDPDGSAIYYENNSTFRREFKLDFGGNLVYDYYWIEDAENKKSVFMDCTEATEASLPAVYDRVKYSENFNKIGYTSTAQLGQVFKYGRDGESNRRYRDGEPLQVAKFGAMKPGTGGIQYAASPGVLATVNDYENNTFTDQFGNIWRFESAPGESRTYYPNNTYTARIYDPDGHLESIIHRRINKNGNPEEHNTETVLESFSYQYDNNGNITKINYANGEYTDYSYDNLSRLISEERKTSTGDSIYKIEYLFDNNDAKNGNIHQVTVNNTDTTTFDYNEMNELTGITHPDNSTETLTYDNNGNLTQTINNTTGETTTYEWDCFDRMTGVTMPSGDEIKFTYDGENQMTKIEYPDMTVDLKQRNGDIIRRVAKVRFNGMETPVEKEISSYDVIVNGQILSRYNSNPVFTSGSNSNNASRQEFCHYDHNNNLALITDSFGNIQWKNLMDAYGNVLPLPDSTTTKPTEVLTDNLLTGGAGVFYIQRAKMFNMRRRFYKGSLRRFISIDPVVQYSIYSYSNNNSVNYYDPSGLITIPAQNPDIFSISIDGVTIRQKLTNVVNNINTAAGQGNQNISTEAWQHVFCDYCPNTMTRQQVYSLVNSATINFDDRLTYLQPAHSMGNNIYLGPLALIQSENTLATIIVHELAHHQDCNNSWERPFTIPYFNPHGCCDVIAYALRFRSHILERGTLKRNMASQLLSGLQTLGASQQAQQTAIQIRDTPYSPTQIDMQDYKYKVWLWPNINTNQNGWNILGNLCYRRWSNPSDNPVL